MASIADCVVSFIDGRARLRHPALKDSATADAVAAVVGGVDGVTEARVNPVTGSLLVYYDTERLSRERLLDLARQGFALLPDDRPEARPFGGLRAALSPKVTRRVDRVLLCSLLCSLAAAATGMGAVHRITGAVFAAASLQHVAAHRKALWP